MILGPVLFPCNFLPFTEGFSTSFTGTRPSEHSSRSMCEPVRCDRGIDDRGRFVWEASAVKDAHRKTTGGEERCSPYPMHVMASTDKRSISTARLLFTCLLPGPLLLMDLPGGLPVLALQSLLFVAGVIGGAWVGSQLLRRVVLTA